MTNGSDSGDAAIRHAITTKLDLRALGVPGKFRGGANAGPEFREWAFSTSNYFIVHGIIEPKHLKAIETRPVVITEEEIPAEHLESSRIIWYALSQLLQGEAQATMRRIPGCNGFEVWRTLHLRYNPQDDIAQAGQLQHILNWRYTGNDPEVFLQRLEEWEQEVRRYDTMSPLEELGDGVASGREQ